MDAKNLLKASTVLSDVVNCLLLWVEMSEKRWVGCVCLKELLEIFRFILKCASRAEINSRFFDLIMDFMPQRKSRNRFRREGELVDFALFLIFMNY